MKRILLASALAVTMFGCTETDPNKINNDGSITGEAADNTPTKQTFNPDAASTGGMGKSEGAKSFPTGKTPITADQIPDNYPGRVPDGSHPSDAKAPELEGPKTDGDAPKTVKVSLTEDELAEIKKLPEAEQALAIAQAVCPVSGHNLGSMEKPIKIEHDGKTAFLCCEGCKGDFDADPAAVMAKLAK